MLPRRKRLSRELFPSALKGRRLSSEHFSVVFPREASGYAVVVAKKTVKLSVDRHRLKRRVFAALETFPLPPSLIVFPKASVQLLKSEQLRDELSLLIAKAPH